MYSIIDDVTTFIGLSDSSDVPLSQRHSDASDTLEGNNTVSRDTDNDRKGGRERLGPLDSDYGWAVKFVRGRREVPFLLLMNRNNWPSIVTLVAYFVTSTCKEEAIIKWRVSRKKEETSHAKRERSRSIAVAYRS